MAGACEEYFFIFASCEPLKWAHWTPHTLHRECRGFSWKAHSTSHSIRILKYSLCGRSVTLNVIIPLRLYLEKIKVCRRPDIFRIRQWVRGNDRILNVDARISLCVFPLTRCHAQVLSMQQRCFWACCFCLCVFTFNAFCRIKSCYFAIKSS